MKPQQHPLADIQSPHIGPGTRIWQFVVILSGARIGADCNICSHVLIENDVTVGNRVTVKSGVQLWDGLRIEDDVFIRPNVTFTNDPFPRSKQYPTVFAAAIVKASASIEVGNSCAGYRGNLGCPGWRRRSDRQNGTGQRRGGGQAGAYRVQSRWQL